MYRSIEDIKRKALPILKEAGISRSSVFGSVVRGEATKDSDVDILVEFPAGKTLFDLVDLRMKLEEALKTDVDVLTYRSISPLLKDIILSEQVRIL